MKVNTYMITAVVGAIVGYTVMECINARQCKKAILQGQRDALNMYKRELNKLKAVRDEEE